MRLLRSALSRLFPLFLLSLFTVSVFGQASYTAQIRGVITDQSGAVVPNVTVTVTNDDTGIVTTSRTNGEGLYILTGLRPAAYTLRAQVAGFQAVEKEGAGVAG